jgi:SAM-dependent methyltransferase
MYDVGHDAAHWDERYAASDYSGAGVAHDHSEPAPAVLNVLQALKPGGRALDVGTGRGRHALWLAANGWDVTAIDFSAVGIDQARATAAATAGAGPAAITWLAADIRDWTPEDPSYDLVLCAYIKLDPLTFARLRSWLAPHGRLAVVGHAVGPGPGPTEPKYRYTAVELAQAATGLAIERLAATDGVLTLVARNGSRLVGQEAQ